MMKAAHKHHEAFVEDFLSARDRLTGLRGASILSTSSGIRELDREIPGPKEIHLFDFNGMSDANRFGMRQNVDDFLREMPERVTAVLAGHGLNGELLRLGGDEFVIVLEHRPGASERCMSAVLRELQSLRGECFDDDERMRGAEWFNGMKNAFRQLRAEYCENLRPGEHFSFEYYRQFLDDNPEQVEERARTVSRPVMSVCAAGRLIKEDFTVERVNQALGQCAWSVHSLKKSAGRGCSRRSRVTPLGEALPEDRTSESFVRGADAAEICGADHRQAGYREIIEGKKWFEAHEDSSYREYVAPSIATADFFRLRDNVLEQTVRLDYARSLLLADYVGPRFKRNAKGCRREDLQKRPKIGVLTIDLHYFSVFNNQWDYSRANALMIPVEKKLLELHPWLLVRSGGGTLTAIVNRILNLSGEEIVNGISSAVTEALIQAIEDSPEKDKLMAECYERSKLAEAGNAKFGLGLKVDGFPSVQVSYREEPVYRDGGMTESREVGELFRMK